MTRKQKVCVALAACHLALVTYCGFSLPVPAGSAGNAVRWYGSMTGATSSYGFFKFINGTCRVRFKMEAADGRVWTDVLKRADNPEAETRYRLAAFQFGAYGEAIAKHCVATMFARHPDAVKVTVLLERYDPPNMADFRSGKRAEWTLVYENFFWKRELVFPDEKGATP